MRSLVLLVALVVGGCASASAGPGTGRPRSPAPPGRTALVAHLGILRRPATSADSGPALKATLRQLAQPGCERLVSDPGFTRLAATTSAGTRVYVVAFKPATCVPHCTGTERMCIRPLPRQEMVAIIPEPGGEGFPQIATLSDLEAGRAVAADRGWQFTLVPDGVVRVVLQVTSSGKPYALTAPVRQNVAVLHTGAPGTMLWLNAAGRVLSRAALY